MLNAKWLNCGATVRDFHPASPDICYLNATSASYTEKNFFLPDLRVKGKLSLLKRKVKNRVLNN